MGSGKIEHIQDSDVSIFAQILETIYIFPIFII